MAVIGTSNISVESIGQTLNEAGGSVDINSPAAFFTSAAKINKWARYKPTCFYYTPFGDTSDVCKAKYGNLPNDYNSDGDFGVCPEVGYDDNSSVEATRAGMIKSCCDYDWVYALPAGGSVYPLRLGDFRGYNTDAEPILYVSSYYQSATVNKIDKTYIMYQLNWVESYDNPDCLGVEDFCEDGGTINLTKCKLYGALFDPSGNFLQLEACDEYIMNSSDSSGEAYVRFNLTSLANWRDARVYLALRQEYDSGYSKFFPIPMHPQGASFPLYLTITSDTASGGIGISDILTDFYVSPRLITSSTDTSYLELAVECCEYGYNEGLAQYYFKNADGNLSVYIKITNNTSSSKTYTTSNFTITTDNVTSKTPYNLLNSNLTSISSITIASNSSQWVYVGWEAVLPTITGSNTYNGSEIFFYLNGVELFSSTFYHQFGTLGWYGL